MIQSIVYTSNTGHTRQYAQLLGDAVSLPVCSLEESAVLPAGASVIYLGWLMAGSVKGYAKAAKTLRVDCVIGVGMAPAGFQVEAVRKANGLPEDLPVFTLQGGYDRSRLSGVYGLMMDMLTKMKTRALKKASATEADREMVRMLQEGGNWVSAEALEPVLDWYRSCGK